MKDAFQIIKYPSSTEKSIRLMEAENKLCFFVDKKASKAEIRDAFEKVYNVKVVKISTCISEGKKKAYVKLSPETPAIDLATRLGMM